MKNILQFILGLIVLVVSLPVFGQPGGWIPNPRETEAFVATIPAVYGNQVADLAADDTNADVLLYRGLALCLEEHGLDDWIKRRGNWKVVNAYNQGNVGSCVGNATAGCLSVLNSFEVHYRKEPQRFTAMHSADAMYGLARQAANMLGNRGDGCTGSGAAKAITEYGTLYCVKYDDADLTKNIPSRAREYGSRGVGEGLRKEAEKHKVASVYRVRSGNEAWSLIGSGYPINVCSTQGFTKQRNQEGICQPSGTWYHSMAVIARRTTSDGRKLFLIWNSWGNNGASGPYWEDMPEGSFWAEFRVVDGMMKSGDCFAYSGLEGFPARTLPDYGSKYYLGKLQYESEANNENEHSVVGGRDAIDRVADRVDGHRGASVNGNAASYRIPGRSPYLWSVGTGIGKRQLGVSAP